MNKTLTINLAGYIFHIDENAYHRLERYLSILKRQFAGIEGGSEIISDIELRIAELFKERISDSKEVITDEDVQEVIAIMGKPEDYLDPEDEAGVPPEEPPYTSRNRRIYRDPDNRILGGVSAGVAAYFNIDALWIRLLFVILTISGPGVLIYIIMWIIIPKATTTAEKLQMRGEQVNISSIHRSIRDEMKNVEDSARRFSRKAADYNYRHTGSQLSRFFGDLGRFIAEALRIILKVVLVIIGVFFLFIGFVVLFALVAAFFAGSAQILGTEFSLNHGLQFLQMLTESEAHYNMLIAAIILTVAAPLFLIIYLGIRLLFNLEPLNRPTKSALALTTFIGLVLLVISGVRIGLQMDGHGSSSRDVVLAPATSYYLTGIEDSISEDFRGDFNSHWRFYNSSSAFNLVDVDIRQSERGEAYLEITTRSQGASNREARYYAQQLDYDPDVQDSLIALPLYYLLNNEAKFRAQEVKVVLYLPPGSSVYIDDNLGEYLDDVKNLQNTYDWNMTGQYWDMTERGLSCRGCEIPGSGEDAEIQYDGDSLTYKGDSLVMDGDSVLIYGKQGRVKMKIHQEKIKLEMENARTGNKLRIGTAEDSLWNRSPLHLMSRKFDVTV